MDVKTQENVRTKDSIETTKRWFNGPKKFSTVKVSPVPPPPPPLGIQVAETATVTEKIG